MNVAFTSRLQQWLLLVACFLPTFLIGQTTGDLAFVGFNGDGNDGFAFVTLVDIPANTDIWFTDEEWDGLASAFSSATSEGDVVWNNSVMTPAGTVIDVDGLSSTPTASLGSIATGTNGGAGLSSTDEGLYAYLGTQRNPTVFLTAITNGVWGAGGGDLTGTGLTAGTTALEFGNAADLGAYTGPRLGQVAFAGYSPLIYDLTTNWIFDDGSGDQSNDGNAPDIPFDVTPFALGTSDNLAPVPFAASLTSASTILIEFNEPLDTLSAENTANYSFSPSLLVNSADIQGTDSVVLSTATLIDGVTYTLSISGVEDTAGNAISPAVTFELIFNGSTPSLVITEIMYNNPGDDSLEFVEIVNASLTPANLGGLTFAEGIDFTFPSLTLAPGAVVLIAVDTAAASNFFGVPFPHQFGGALGNGGEDLLIVNSLGDTIDLVDYDDAAPWPVGPPSPDGDGPSIELLNPTLDNNLGPNWFASTTFVANDGSGNPINATPGTVSVLSVATVSINMTNQSVREDTGAFMIEVNLNGLSTDTVKVKLATTTFSTATGGADYMLADTTLVTFVPNQIGQTETIMVPVMDDTDAETDEYVSFRLAEPENATIAGGGTHLVWIRDNDRMAPVASGSIELELLTSYLNNPAPGGNSAEIVQFDPTSQRLFVANSTANSLDIIDFSDPAAPVAISSIDMSIIGDLTSVAVFDTLVAVAAANPNQQLPGTITFFDTTGTQLAQVTAGALPDMVTFTHDGQKVLVANEGQPSDDYSVDPEGSISIIDVSAGVANLTQADVTTADFTAFNGQIATLEADGVRISGLSSTTVAEDLEPEFITVSSDNLTAWVACQENNAVAVVDLLTNTVTAVLGMGYKDWSAMIGLDAENETDNINLASYPFKGIYMPDAIASYEVGGMTYLVTANEGDAREYSALVDESRLEDSNYKLDSLAFPNADIMKANIGRIKTINTEGDIDGDGDFDEIYVMGGRSFSIWDGATGDLVYDSGDDFGNIISMDPVFGAIFNSNDDGTSPKSRSDDKGPEPEGVTMGMINGKNYAFIALERVGGVMVYDVTNPTMPEFVQYINTKLSNGDFAPEGLVFIPSDQSPNGFPLLVTANEVSSTLSVFKINGEITGQVSFAETQQTVDEDAGTLEVVLTLQDANPDSTVTVDVLLGSFFTADAGSDFTLAATQTVTFQPGDTAFALSIPVVDDSDAENDEYFAIALANPTNTFLGKDNQHTAYLLDNDRMAAMATEAITLDLITSLGIGVAGDDAAEIVDYDPLSQTLFVANSEANQIEMVDFSNPANPTLMTPIDVSTYGGINSVAVYDGVVAAAIENDDTQANGSVVFFDNAGSFLAEVTAGALPDMVTFTPDGSKVLVANEGEPNDDYTVDPEGSVGIIDVSGGVANVTQADVTIADFTAFNGQQAQLVADGVRIFGPNATVAQDLEPEYITVSAGSDTAWVVCQENNAVAVVDIQAGTIVAVLPLGFKDHSLPGNGLDAEDRSDFVRIANYPVLGTFMPDAIASYQVGGKTYLVTANEGDAREYDAYVEERRLGDDDYLLDSLAFPDGDLLKANIGRLKVTTARGDTDGDGDFDEIYTFGARSFSIWDGTTGSLVYDSGDGIELYLSQHPTWGPLFNSNDDELDFKTRSDDKGPEPEAVVVSQIGSSFYAFLALERMGGVMVFDVTDPTAPVFVDYDNNRDSLSDGGDLAPEGLVTIPTNESPDGKYYLVVANEVSSTLTIYEVTGTSVSVEEELAALPLRVFPNPARDGVQVELSQPVQGQMQVRLLNLNGQTLIEQQAGHGFTSVNLPLEQLPAGVYIIDVLTDQGRAQQRLIKQ